MNNAGDLSQLGGREFYPELVTALVKAMYGKTPSNDAWKKWREWAGVGKRSKVYSWEQLCFILAIAAIRRRSPKNNPELNANQVALFAGDVAFQEKIANAIGEVDKVGIVGRGIVSHYARQGLKVTEHQLRYRIDDFKAKRIYDEGFLKIAIGY